MENFTVYNPTSVHFGKDVIQKLGETVKEYGQKVLLIYGKGSVIKYGYYEQVTDQLKKANIDFVEYAGIKPNPEVRDADAAVSLGADENAEVVVALGGGSVIDTAKAVAVSIPERLNVWDVVTGKRTPSKALPLITILTLAATGTEMNHFSVLQNSETNEKLGFGNSMMYPAHSFLDPQYTITVSPDYTSYGVSDIIAHAFENYFGYGNSPLADRFAASVVKEAMDYGKLILESPDNYDFRANILLQSTYALNGTTNIGKTGGDWGVHDIGHTLSMLYDTPHGASLSVAYPAWLKLFKDRIPDRISKLGSLVFDETDIDRFINKLIEFYKAINCPVSMNDLGINSDKKDEILKLFKDNKVSGSVHKITDEDYDVLLSYMYM
jgi:alcohol dehydrogenase YqhD (iron-dependent ADH family)